MRIRKIAGAGIATAVLGTLFLGGTAIANPTGTPATSSTAGVTAANDNTCPGQWNFTAKETVKIRASKSTSASARGQINKGQRASDCSGDGKLYTGGSYKLCGKKSNKWMKMGHKGVKGWVPRTCLKGGPLG